MEGDWRHSSRHRTIHCPTWILCSTHAEALSSLGWVVGAWDIMVVAALHPWNSLPHWARFSVIERTEVLRHAPTNRPLAETRKLLWDAAHRAAWERCLPRSFWR